MKPGKVHWTAWRRCPWCSTLVDGATETTATEKDPDDGSISICAYCLYPSIFDAATEGGLRYPTDEEMDDLMASEEVIKAVRVAIFAKVMERRHQISIDRRN